MSGVADPAEFRVELRAAWRALYHNAIYCWAETFYPELNELRDPDFPGPVMNRRFDPLSSCWLEILPGRDMQYGGKNRPARKQ